MTDPVKAMPAAQDPWAAWPNATQRRIAASALDSFAERGFHGTSLRHIAQGSGLSTAALYVHFASKEEVLFALARHGHALALALVREAAADPDPGRALDVLVRAFTGWHAEHRTLARVVQYELGALDGDHRAEVLDLRRQTERTVRDLVGRGAAAGVLSVPDVRAATAAILSLGIDVARWYEPGGRWTPDELGAHYAELAAGLLGMRDPGRHRMPDHG
ncbi:MULTISPECIES: TetR/AcrR family transcriptional regulator [unclassified Pseudonocardia]|uniref:TetR/AcrR family transcriptional regulator n=1 Tax=unclassified Pseudonocardia TaxID=2619320 RepID=UPI0001FFE3AA|nr:TetR/AcrR family transcriptional regulator [Pseudonocardia sp. Ae707_Ps1]OLM18246.1 Transcriptional regulator, TetR family [Pseudonocardia sp. Ae707_Ps1]